MFRKPTEVIKAPAADRKELAWLKERLNPGPVAPELMYNELNEADESEAMSHASDGLDLDESQEDEPNIETSDDSLDEFAPVRKKMYGSRR